MPTARLRSSKFPFRPTGQPSRPKSTGGTISASISPRLPPIADLVLRLQTAKKYEQVIAVIEGALVGGQAQPWMYDVLAVTMQMAGAQRRRSSGP